jgi:hypothetical protein
LHRGSALMPGSATEIACELGEEDFVLNRIEDVKLPEWQIVEAFHTAWGHSDFRPARGELELAREMIGHHGLENVQALIPLLVKRLKLKWADAKTFNAVSRYLPEVMQDLERERSRERREKMEEQQRDESRQRTIRQAQDRAVLKALWEALSPAEQDEIRTSALRQQPANIVKFPGIVENFCLEELAKRKGLSIAK